MYKFCAVLNRFILEQVNFGEISLSVTNRLTQPKLHNIRFSTS